MLLGHQQCWHIPLVPQQRSTTHAWEHQLQHLTFVIERNIPQAAYTWRPRASHKPRHVQMAGSECRQTTAGLSRSGDVRPQAETPLEVMISV